ncbi:MAG TPA: tetratricopeptide repeat protein, partial [Tepidisphaeraceae bacterium]|nr:tetratricopeptide repeat protein [Tepidisphaeraceae bacterium]
IYDKQNQHADAVRAVDAIRAKAANDPDLLYTLSAVYSRLGEKQRSEAALADVLKADPSFAGANNDLGYTWAEQGRNLGEAESLVRKALQVEPDNLSFLDSMGWVLYKRGKFDEALQKLTRAALLADPVVLDHLGDTLYRLGQRARAADQWHQAVQRITDLHQDDRDSLKQLHEQLLKKQQELDAGQPVGVAPVSER